MKTPWIIGSASKTMFKLGWVTISCVNGSSRSHSTLQWRSIRCARSCEGGTRVEAEVRSCRLGLEDSAPARALHHVAFLQYGRAGAS